MRGDVLELIDSAGKPIHSCRGNRAAPVGSNAADTLPQEWRRLNFVGSAEDVIRRIGRERARHDRQVALLRHGFAPALVADPTTVRAAGKPLG
jgi:hypothetical protein